MCKNLKLQHRCFEPFVGFYGADVMPLAFVNDDPPDRAGFFYHSSDKDRNDGFDFVCFKKLEERCLHGIDAGKEAALNSRVSQGVPKIANLTSLIDVYIQKRPLGSQGKSYLWSLLLMDFQEPLQGKIGYHIAIVAEDGLVLVQEIFNVFQSSCRVQKDGFMAKEYGPTAPSPVRKFFRVDFRAMMGVHDEAIHADFQKMIHCVGDDGTFSDLQERLGTSLRQRPKPRPQPGCQDEGGLESSSFQ
jgi:hypothetical protein